MPILKTKLSQVIFTHSTRETAARAKLHTEEPFGIGDRGEEILPFNRQKAGAEPDSVQTVGGRNSSDLRGQAPSYVEDLAVPSQPSTARMLVYWFFPESLKVERLESF